MKLLSRVRFFDWRVCQDRSTREENWIPSSTPRILSPLLWRRVCGPSALSAASFSVSAKPATSHSHYPSSADKTFPQPDLSVLLTEQCYLIKWCQNPESGFLSISKSCNFYFKNTSPTLHSISSATCSLESHACTILVAAYLSPSLYSCFPNNSFSTQQLGTYKTADLIMSP